MDLLTGIEHEQCNALLFNSQVAHLVSFLLNGHPAYSYENLAELSELSIEEYRAKILQKECENIKIKF